MLSGGLQSQRGVAWRDAVKLVSLFTAIREVDSNLLIFEKMMKNLCCVAWIAISSQAPASGDSGPAELYTASTGKE